MSRRLRISAPPPAGGPDALWFQQVTDAINGLPNFSLSSTSNGPESYVTGDSGMLLIDVGSSATTLWFKESGTTTTGWVAIDFV